MGIPVRLNPDLEAEFKSLRDGEALLRGFYEWVDSMNATFVAPHTALSEQGMIAAKYQIPQIGRGVMEWYQRVVGLRATHLLNECVHALNENRMYSFVLTARALIEMGAGVAHYLAVLSDHADAFAKDPGRVLDFIKTLDTAITGSRFQWSDFTKGGTEREALREKYAKRMKVESATGPANVMTMIEKLERRLSAAECGGTAAMIHAMLSDVCHPAVGGNLLLWSLDGDRMVISGDYDLSKRRVLVTTIVPALYICAAIIGPAFADMDALVARVTAPFGAGPPPSAI